jgi:hypothetical protein
VILPLLIQFGLIEILHFLLTKNLIDGNIGTVTGKTLGENLDRWVHKHGVLEFEKQDVIRPIENPIKPTGHIRFVKTNSNPIYLFLCSFFIWIGSVHPSKLSMCGAFFFFSVGVMF